MQARCGPAHASFPAMAHSRMRCVGLLLALLVLSPASQAAIEEVNGQNPSTLAPPVSIGSYVDFYVQLKNTGATSVNFTSFTTTGPFIWIGGTCGGSAAPGATCNGNIGVRFSPTTAGNAAGTLVVGNDSGAGPFTLNLIATGTSLLAPTLTAVFSPSSLYSGTGVSTLTFTLTNPNAVPLYPTLMQVPMRNVFTTVANPNPTSTCGGGNWFSPGNASPANQSYVYFTNGSGPQPVVPANGSCAISIDVASANAPGTYPFAFETFVTAQVWSTVLAATTVTIIAPVAGTPGSPTITTATAGNAQATVTFTAPADAGSSAITGYTVTSRPPGGVDGNAGTTALSHVITGLANGTAYTFSVSATNATGAGPPSASSSAVTPMTVPGAPTNAIATAGNAQALVTFSRPIIDGGSAITGYTVTSTPAGGVDGNAGSLGFSHTITGLANGTTYTFTATANNMVGTSAPSVASNSIMPAIPVVRTPPQLTYRVGPTRSVIPVSAPFVPPGPRVLSYAFAYNGPRTKAFVDVNNDGLIDIIIAPGYSQHQPFFPVEIWLNNGDGTYRNGTAEVIDGAPPITRGVDDILIGDFNNDGKPDAFFVDTGIESPAPGDPSGGFNSLLLSQPNGKYRDATTNITPNLAIFNHNGMIGDINGDGHLDVTIARVSSSEVQAAGIILIPGNGNGNFVETIQGLPPEISFKPVNQTNYQVAQNVSCVGLGDLDGDGRPDLLSGTGYTNDADGQRTVRIFGQQSGGGFAERLRIPIPSAISNIGEVSPTIGPDGRGLGCPEIIVADLNADGRPDLIVEWEGAGKWYVQILRNDGNYQFTDITLAAMGSFNMGFLDNGSAAGPGRLKLMDLNGDGTPDLVYLLNGTSLPNLLPHTALLNDGNAIFTPWAPQIAGRAMTASDIYPVSQCTFCAYLPMFVPMGPRSLPRLLLMDYQSSVTTSLPTQTTTVYLTSLIPQDPYDYPTVPAPPVIGTPIPGNGMLAIAFSPPQDSGGAPITGYTASCIANSVITSASRRVSPISLLGLGNGIVQSCSVVASNRIGASAASAIVNVTPSASAPFAFIDAKSRKTHAAAGMFDLPIDAMPSLGGPITVEPRAGVSGHNIVFSFSGPISLAGAALAFDAMGPLGSVGQPTFATNEVTVPLSGVPDNRRLTVRLSGVNSQVTETLVSIGFLVGDLNSSRAVNASDVSAIKAHLGQTTNQSNFWFDVNASGGISMDDVSAVKARSGVVLP